MPTPHPDDVAAAHARMLASAERAISATLGAPLRLSDPTAIGDERKTTVWRAQVTSAASTANAAPDLPATVVIKQADMTRYHPDEPVGVAAGLFNDWAGARFLSELAASHPHPADSSSVPLSPRFYGGDRAAGLIALEDLGGGTTLVEPLCGTDAGAAEAALIALAQTLGRLHATTIGQHDTFWRLRTELGPVAPATFIHAPARMRAELPELFATLARLGLAPDSACQAELAATLDELGQPGPFYAYTHGDPCPDNLFLRADGTLRLYDYEMGAYRHALLDGIYAHMQFPTCWCAGRTPEAVVARVEAAYRAALATGCPAAHDDHLFARAVVAAAAYWVCVTLARGLDKALAHDEQWGLATIRPRLVTRLDAFARLADARGHLPHTAHLARQLSAELRRRWPAAECELALYPAFR